MGDTDVAVSKSVQIIYNLPNVRFLFIVNLASEGNLLMGKFTFTGGEFRKAGGDFYS